MPPASAFGAKDTQARPTSRGRACFVSFLMGQRCGQTATGPRAGGRQCRRPEPLAPCRRAHAPRAGGMGASFRSEWGGLCMRRRQAHEQGPVACGGFFGGSGGGKGNGRRICSAVQKELSRKCRSPLLFHPPLRQGGDLRPFAAFPGRSEIGGMASTETDPESFFESVGKSTGVAHTTG